IASDHGKSEPNQPRLAYKSIRRRLSPAEWMRKHAFARDSIPTSPRSRSNGASDGTVAVVIEARGGVNSAGLPGPDMVITSSLPGRNRWCLSNVAVSGRSEQRERRSAELQSYALRRDARRVV